MHDRSGNQFFRITIEMQSGPDAFDKEIPESSRLEFFEEFLGNNFAEGGIWDLPLLRTLLAICQNSQEQSFWEDDGLFCFISICKFGSFKTPFAKGTSLSELYFTQAELKWFLWTMAENYGDEWSLTWYLQWGIFSKLTPLIKFTSISRSTEFKDILSWNIS